MDQIAPADTWSPADNPYAIAVSEGQWWMWTAELCARRIREGRDPDRQIDTRQFIMALRQLLYAAEMEKREVQHLDPAVLQALGEARQHFDQSVPGLTDARNVLVHFDEYARGEGKLQHKLRKQGVDAATAARQFWTFGYDPATGSVQVGPYEINIEQARLQARQLFRAIYTAAQAVDAAGAGRQEPTH